MRELLGLTTTAITAMAACRRALAGRALGYVQPIAGRSDRRAALSCRSALLASLLPALRAETSRRSMVGCACRWGKARSSDGALLDKRRKCARYDRLRKHLQERYLPRG